MCQCVCVRARARERVRACERGIQYRVYILFLKRFYVYIFVDLVKARCAHPCQ